MPPKAFKPPRPSTLAASKTSTPKSTTSRKRTSPTISKTRTTKPKSKEKGKPKQRGNSTFNVSHRFGLPSISPDTDVESDDPFASSKIDQSSDPVEIDSQQNSHAEGVEEEEEERRQSIPPDLLTRLLHDNFKEQGTRLSKDASHAVGKYMEIFVREAMARAAFIRVDIEEKRGGQGDGFLEVEDLEVLAPQLLLDF